MSERGASYADSERADRAPLDQRARQTVRSQERTASRFSMPTQVTVGCLLAYEKLHEMPKRFWVSTRDVSASGISFCCRHRMYYGERLRVELRMDGGELRDVAARVVRCRRGDDGSFEIGAAFETGRDALPPAEPNEADADGADM